MKKKLPSGTWRCQVMVDGKRVSVVAETPGEAQAKAVAIKAGLIEKAAERKAFLSLADAIDQYIEMKEGALSPSTVRGYETVKKHRFSGLRSCTNSRSIPIREPKLPMARQKIAGILCVFRDFSTQPSAIWAAKLGAEAIGTASEYGLHFPQVFKTITVDNGSEFADFAQTEHGTARFSLPTLIPHGSVPRTRGHPCSC